MVDSTLSQGAHYLGRVPANFKFPAHQVFEDASYLSGIHPDRKSKKKGATAIAVQVVEYTIEQDGKVTRCR